MRTNGAVEANEHVSNCPHHVVCGQEESAANARLKELRERVRAEGATFSPGELISLRDEGRR